LPKPPMHTFSVIIVPASPLMVFGRRMASEFAVDMQCNDLVMAAGRASRLGVAGPTAQPVDEEADPTLIAKPSSCPVLRLRGAEELDQMSMEAMRTADAKLTKMVLDGSETTWAQHCRSVGASHVALGLAGTLVTLY